MYLLVPTKSSLLKGSANDLFDDVYVILPDFLYKGVCCGYPFELHWLHEIV